MLSKLLNIGGPAEVKEFLQSVYTNLNTQRSPTILQG